MDVMVVSLSLAQVSLPASRGFLERRNKDIFPRKEDGGSQECRKETSPQDCAPERTGPASYLFPVISPVPTIVPGTS